MPLSPLPWNGARKVTALLTRRQMVACGELSQFQPAGDAQLLEDIRQVVLDRLFADRERLGDLLVPGRRDDELHHLQLALGEAEGGTLGAIRRTLHTLQRNH